MNDLIKKWEALADGLEEDALSAGFKEHAIKWEAEMSALRKCAAELRSAMRLAERNSDVERMR